jgi:putative flavoprotein involved in K+ transport
MTLSHPRANDSDEHCDVAVIGAGQAGLAIGHFLKRHGLRFLILEKTGSVGAPNPTLA